MDFRFCNLLGAPYRGGTILFDGPGLLSPVGNRVQRIDIRQCCCRTLPIECLQSILVVCVSPCGRLLLLFDVEGRLVVVNKQRETVLHHMKFKDNVRCAAFSPDGKFVAIGCGKRLQIWRSPSTEKTLAPMCLHRSFNAVAESISSIDWTSDSFGVVAGSRDMMSRIFTRDPVQDYTPAVLGGHRGAIIGTFFTSEQTMKTSEIAHEVKDRSIHLITVGAMGRICEWSYEKNSANEDPISSQESEDPMNVDITAEINTHDKTGEIDERSRVVYIDASEPPDTMESLVKKPMRKDWMFHDGRWIRCGFHNFQLSGRTSATDAHFHKVTGLMVIGFSNGVFELVQFPGFHRRQVLSVSQERLTTVRFSGNAEWIGIGCAKLGQVLVWDWRSETQVLKQQGHTFDVSSIAFSPDGSRLVTGAADLKLKVFSTATGFCTMTFQEHLMPIKAVQFLRNGNAVVSASLDGTVRAFDLVRGRIFRTFSAPDPVQFCCLAVDPNGEFVAAGSADSFQIYVWSIKTSKLLDILAAHEGPLSALAFNPVQPVIASSSWDKTVKLWDVFGTSKGNIETLIHGHDVTTFTFRPDGKQLAAATLDGGIHLWDPFDAEELGKLDTLFNIAIEM